MRDLSKFRLHDRLIRSIRRSSDSLTALAAPHGLTQAALSAYLHGKVFGPTVRRRVMALGLSLGVRSEFCAPKVRS